MPQVPPQSHATDPSFFPTSVQPPETYQQIEDSQIRVPAAPSPNLSISFRHSGWRRYREQIAEAFDALGLPEARRARFAACGEGGWVWQHPDDPTHFRVTGNCCHDRWCLPCGAARGRTIAQNILGFVGNNRLRFITLTMAHSDASLREQLDRLQASFVRLRRTAFWNRKVTGGVAFLEIKATGAENPWHVHFHIIAEGKYVPHAVLKAVWHRITGNSWVVDVREVQEREQVIRYTVKYASKPLDHSVFSTDETLTSAIEAMHGRRTGTTFGSWRGLLLTKCEDDIQWVSIGPLSELIQQSQRGDVAAKQILLSIHRETYARKDDDP